MLMKCVVLRSIGTAGMYVCTVVCVCMYVYELNNAGENVLYCAVSGLQVCMYVYMYVCMYVFI